MTSKLLNDLAMIVGAENVVTDEAALGSYACASGFVCGKTPVAIARCFEAGQVEKIVKLANEEDFKLLPVSSADEHLHGGTVPAVDNTVIVDLSGMKKIADADRTFRMAVLEPGVTYGELIPYLKEKGLMVDMPLAPKAGKSVVASLIETEPRLNPNMQWNSFDPLRSTEVVWGDGTRMRTGEAAASPLNKDIIEATEHMHNNHKYFISPNGPDNVDFYRLITGAQGTMGIVTWISMKCAILPEAREAYLIPTDCLKSATEFVYGMEHQRAGDGLAILNAFDFAALMASSKEEIDALVAKLPKYIVLAVVAGRPPLPELRVAAHKVMLDIAAAKACVPVVRELAGFTATEVMEKAFAPCEEGKYWQDTYTGKEASIIFLTTLDRSVKFTEIMKKAAADAGFDNIGVYIQPKHQGISCRVEFSIPYCDKCADKAEALFNAASEQLAAEGAFFSRPYGGWAKLALKSDSGAMSRLKRLKKIYDPKNVLAPGRLSDWEALD